MDEPRPQVHFRTEQLLDPPCGTLLERFEWSDELEDVTCEGCREALAGDAGELGTPPDDGALEEHAGR